LQKFLYWLIFPNFLFNCHKLDLKFFYTLSLQKCLFAFYLSFLVSRFLMHILKFCLLLFSSVLIYFFIYTFIPENFCSLSKRVPSKLLQKACCLPGCVGSRQQGHLFAPCRTIRVVTYSTLLQKSK